MITSTSSARRPSAAQVPAVIKLIKPNSHRRAPSFGDVVSVRFPLDEAPNQPGDKKRPGVVVDIEPKNGGTVTRVRVAYTSGQVSSQVQAAVRHGRAQELVPLTEWQAAECGLDAESVVDAGRCAWLPWNSGNSGNAWFAGRAHDGSPFLGRMPAKVSCRLAQALSHAAGRKSRKKAPRRH